MSDGGRQWTIAQKRAIREQGRSLLVSAAAGSGKTAVLSERCAYLVCDSPDPCDVDELLVVTFTEAAAAEMRARIQQALAKRIDSMANPPTRLRRQMALVEHAPISTLHAFCARLLRQNFSLAGLDPQFGVIDADEAMLLRREVGRQMLDARYEHDAAGTFGGFIDAYGNGRDEGLLDQIAGAYELLCSLVSPRDWLNRSLRQISEAGEKPLNKSVLGRLHLADVRTALDRLGKRCTAAIATIKSLGGFSGYLARLQEWSVVIGGWAKTFERKGFDALIVEFGGFAAAKAPAVKADVPNKERAKAVLDSLKGQMIEGDLANQLAFSSEQWQKGQQDIYMFAATFAGLVEEFGDRYAQAKARVRGVDFSDLERKTLQLLRDPDVEGLGPSLVARDCHNQYRFVLVDEYQDVNEIQDAILTLVSTECVAEEGEREPNLFTVGDVKQSIYRFRLAEPQRFLDRDRRFRAASKVGQVIDLQENFRSRPRLLEAINDVFARLMTEEAADIEYANNHQLRPPEVPVFLSPASSLGDQPAFAGSPIEMHLLPKIRWDNEGDFDGEEEMEAAEYEAALCALRILQITGKDGSPPTWVADKNVAGGARPARFGDVVILLRSLKYKSDDFADILRRSDIPVHNSGGSGFFVATEIRDMLALLSLLDNQRQDIPLAAFLRGPMARLPACEEALVRIHLAFSEGTQEEEESVPFHQAVVRYAGEKTDELASRLRDILAQLSRWRDLARQRPLADLIWGIYEQTAYLAYVAGLENGQQRVANLLYLHQRARQFGSFLKQGLHRFIGFLSKLREESDLSQPSLSAEGEESVRIMSVHKSKGLEFPIVIVPDLGKKHNLKDAAGSILLDRKAGLGMSVIDRAKRIRYPSLSWTLTRDSLLRQSRAEELRLLYVAMTRAKEHLILIGTCKDTAAAKWSADYAGHQGALPTEAILSSDNPMDWLGPVQAACGNKTLDLTVHTEEEVRSWGVEKVRTEEQTARLAELAALKPLAPAPVVDDEAAAVIARFEMAYSYVKYTRLPAATPATSYEYPDVLDLPLTHQVPQPSTTMLAGEDSNPLEMPAFLSNDSVGILTPAQIGDVTHRVLEHLDFARDCNSVEIDVQIDRLVERGILRENEAAAIDREGIAWFLGTDLGALLKANAGNLWRELPFAASAGTESSDRLDAVMIRGRIDLLVPTAGGVAIVDYKTDRVGRNGVNERAETYRSQLAVYQQAIQRIMGKKVTDIYLVFLTPRVVWHERKEG